MLTWLPILVLLVPILITPLRFPVHRMTEGVSQQREVRVALLSIQHSSFCAAAPGRPVPVGAVALVDRGRSDGALLGRGHGARRARHVIVGHHRGPHRLQRAVRGVPPARQSTRRNTVRITNTNTRIPHSLEHSYILISNVSFKMGFFYNFAVLIL